MENDKNNGEKEKGFAVKDRRFSAKKEEEADSQIKEEGRREEPPQKEPSGQDIPLPEISFTNFIFSLSTSALIHLGEIEDPIAQQSAKNLPLAKQTIDLIGMLREKTKGNLTPDEDKMMEYILYDLRMRYVKAAG
jgi:hypothetical protein